MFHWDRMDRLAAGQVDATGTAHNRSEYSLSVLAAPLAL
jgi:hypothetical protein